MRTKFVVVIGLLIIAVSLYITLPVSSFTTQENDFVINALSARNVPIKIVSFKVKDSTLKSGEKFSGSDELLKELQINIENGFGKTVTHISLGLLFPRPVEQKGDPPAYYRIRRGLRKEALLKEVSGFEIRPDADKNKLNIYLSQEELETLLPFLVRQNYPNTIKRIKVQVDEVVFDDGTIWSIGSWFRADPSDSKKLIPIEDMNGLSGNPTNVSSQFEKKRRTKN